jgi:hypothetical protein
MTKTKKFLDALASGPHTLESLAEATGLEIEYVRRSIWNMRFLGYIDTKPETYALTAKGTVRQMTKPKTPKAVLDKKAAKRKERPKDYSGMVERSIRTNANSVFNLGAQV